MHAPVLTSAVAFYLNSVVGVLGRSWWSLSRGSEVTPNTGGGQCPWWVLTVRVCVELCDREVSRAAIPIQLQTQYQMSEGQGLCHHPLTVWRERLISFLLRSVLQFRQPPLGLPVLVWAGLTALPVSTGLLFLPVSSSSRTISKQGQSSSKGRKDNF